MKHRFAWIIAATPLLVIGCGDDEVDNTLDCAQICDKYSECVTDIDVTECTDQCQERADANPNVEQVVDACESCLDDTNCEEASTCWSACALVGPVQNPD